jgi:uncharacterized protein YndB with AHSA1/START domain
MAARSDTADREILVTRLIDAPRDLVFRAWTDPEHVKHWWGPHGFTTTTQSMDFRAGGEWRFVMHGPDGTDYPNRIVYDEIAPPERLAYRHAPDKGTDPVQFNTMVTFADEGGKTRVDLRMLFPSAQAREHVVEKYGAVEGGNQTVARLAEYVATLGAFEVSRTFDAPRDLVYRAWTEQDRLAQWWGPKGFAMLSCKLDLRAGGVFHYGMRGPDGKEMWGKWVFREVSPPDRLAFVVSFSNADCGTVRAPFSDDWPVEVLSTVTFADENGKTTLRMSAVPIEATAAERKLFDAMHPSMTQGWDGTLDQLAAFLAR